MRAVRLGIERVRRARRARPASRRPQGCGIAAGVFVFVAFASWAGAAQMQVRTETAELRAQFERTASLPAGTTSAMRDGGAPAGRAVLSVLLAPGEEARDVQAPFPAHLLGTGFYHGYGIATLRVLQSDLQAALPLVCTLTLTTAPCAAARSCSQRPDAARRIEIRRQVERLVVNPETLSLYPVPQSAFAAKASAVFQPAGTPSLDGSPVEMLILTTATLESAFQVYADYKTALGTPTVVRTVEWVSAQYPHGADLQETLRGFIRQAYELWGIRYLLLGGDTDLIPARYAASRYTLEGESVPTDLYYACLDGNWNADGDSRWGEGYVADDNSTDMADLYPELCVSRLPVTTPVEVTQYLSKLRAYCEPAEPAYTSKLLFFAEVIWPGSYKPGDAILKNGADNAERLVVFNHLKRPGLVLRKLYETPATYDGAEPLSRDAATARMNEGFGLIADIGHGFRYTMSLGDFSFTNSDALALTNAGRPFFLNMLNCSAAAFDFPCLAEKFVLNPSGGAVGVIGASREAYPDNIQLFQEAWFHEIFTEGHQGAAEALNGARLQYASQTFDDGAYRWSDFILAHLGDPQLQVWVESPRTAVVTYTASVVLGARTLDVQVQDGNGAPVPEATVCLWKQGDAYVVGRTNSAGVAELELGFESPGSASLVVSGAGLLPYRGSVEVLGTAGAALRCVGAPQVLDSGPGASGNGNARLEAGETAFLRFEVRNEGGASAPDGWLTAQATDPGLWISGAAVRVGSLRPGANVLSDPLPVRVSPQVLDQHRVGIDLVLHTATGWTWADRVSVDLLQAVPQLVRTWVDDRSLGNGNGVADDGESYVLRIEVKNYGFGRLDGASGTLLGLDPAVGVLSNRTSFDDLAHLATADGSFVVREADTSRPHRMLVVIQGSAGRSWSFEIETRRPEPAANLLADPSGGPGVALLTWSPSPSSDVLGYNVYRAISAYGPWVRASADLVQDATYYRDDGLQSGTLYHYCVSAVDSSRNESQRTSEVTLATNPQQHPGWPRQLGTWSGSCPLVVDLDGDGKPEVLAAADHVYAWHADGSEVRDGDGNPATQGVLNGAGLNFTAGLASADLDGDGRPEIVASSWDTHEVYVLEGDGSVRPGWPRRIASTLMGIWATPALGDLDLDGKLEVVVLGLDGRLYAWHADGSEVRDGDGDPATQGVLFTVPGNARWSRGAPAIADILPDDPTPEIVFGTENNKIYLLRADGSVAPGWPRQVGDKVTAAPSVGDIDGDGRLEIAVPARDGFLYVLRADGSDEPGWPRPFECRWAALTPSVALHDFDGDGKLELVAGGTDGNTARGSLYMFDWRGEIVPGWPVDLHTASEASPVIGDLDGDGGPEILYGGESGILYGLRPDGTPFPGFPIKVGAEIRATPTIADADGDGRTDVVVTGWDQQVHVWSFRGGFAARNVPWGTFKGSARRDGVYARSQPTDVAPDPGAPPARTLLRANVPNPFNPSTSIRFELAGSAPMPVRLCIYDVRGQRVRTLIDGRLAPGRYEQVWDGRDDAQRASAGGVYFYRLETPAATLGRKMVLVK